MADLVIEARPAGEERFSFLLGTLLALFVLYPLLGSDHMGSAVLDLVVSVALLLTVKTLRGPRKGAFIASLALSITAIPILGRDPQLLTERAGRTLRHDELIVVAVRPTPLWSFDLERSVPDRSTLTGPPPPSSPWSPR